MRLVHRWFAAALVGLGFAGQARAEPPCPHEPSRWVEVRFEGDGWSPSLPELVRAQLASGLAGLGFATCGPEARADAPIAVVVLRAESDSQVGVSVEVDDRVTRKRVARDIALGRFDEQGQALALAVGTEELVRASWAEFALEQAARAELPPPPPEVEQVVVASVRQDLKSPPRVHLGVEGVWEQYARGRSLHGASLAFRYTLTSRVALELQAGVRRSFTERVTQGELRATGVAGSLGLPVTVVRGSRVRLHVVPAVHAVELSLRGAPAGSNYAGTSASTPVAVLRGGALTTVGLGQHVELDLRTSAGLPWVTARALADDVVVWSAEGFELTGGLGLGGTF